MISIEFIDVEEVSLQHLENWFNRVAESENKELGDFSIIIGSDEWLLKHNIQYLDHDFYTDIITFDYCEDDVVSGDLLISLDRVYENATTFNVPRETELNRVLVHGYLHLCGYGDKTPEEEQLMRKKEDFYLALL